MTVGDRIKKIRTEKDISQIDLATKCDVSKQTLYKYENNIVTNIPLTVISKIARALNVSEALLMGWAEPIEIIEMADMDAELIMQDKRLKEYFLKISRMTNEQKEYVMSTIDFVFKGR